MLSFHGSGRRPRCDLMIRTAVAALGLLPVLTGCMQYDWIGDVNQAEQKARSENRTLFVFYKNWLDNTSNRMLGDELSHPDVMEHFQDTVNLLLDQSFAPHKAYVSERFNVEGVPACILVGPRGDFKVLNGQVPRDRLIDWAQRSKLAVGPVVPEGGKPAAP